LPYRPGSSRADRELLPHEARLTLEDLGISVCDSSCEIDGSRTILAVSPPLVPHPLAVERAPGLKGSVVMVEPRWIT
jgi:hypothetical protein